MVCYPDVQKKAQEELDKVLNGRLPEHSDIVSLPYFSALIKEVHRYGEVCFKDSLPHAQHIYLLPDGSLYYHWVSLSLVHKVLSSTPLSRQGLPHQSTTDDLYNGYHIPQNAVVVANQW